MDNTDNTVDNELLDSQELEQQIDAELSQEGDFEDADSLKETNKKLFARAKKAEQELKNLKNKVTETVSDKKEEKEETKENINNINSVSSEKIERLELKIDGYSDSEVDFIMKNGGKTAAKDELVQAAIESTRKQKEAEQAADIQESTKSAIEKKFTPKEIENMSADELAKHIQQGN